MNEETEKKQLDVNMNATDGRSGSRSTKQKDERDLADQGAFIERLRSLMGDRSETAFARAVGISAGGLRNSLANGNPGRALLVKIARGSGVSVGWLATGEGEKWARAAKTPVNTGSIADQGQIQKKEGAPGAGLSDLEIERVREVGAMILELLAAEGVTLTRGAFGDLVRMALWLPDTETTRDLVVRMIRRLAAEP